MRDEEKRKEFPETGENLLQERHSDECAGQHPGNLGDEWLGPVNRGSKRPH